MKPANHHRLDAEVRALLEHEKARQGWQRMSVEQIETFKAKARAALAHRYFLDETASLRHAIAQVYATFLPTRMLVSKPDGKLEMTTADTLTPEARKGVEQLEAYIRQIAQEWGLTLTMTIDAIKD